MDLEAVITTAVEDAGDVGVDDSGSASEAATGTTEVADGAVAAGGSDGTEAAKEATVVEDAFAKEHGLVTKRPDGRENRIPYSRVKAIAENQVKKAQEAWEAGVKSVRDEHGSYKSRLDEFATIERIMESEPDRFIEMLAATNPEAYGKFAAVLKQVVEEAKADAGADDPEPQPDFDMGDGRMTYSMAGLNKVREWDRRQATKAAEQALGKRLEPIEKERQAAQDRERQRQEADRVAASIDATLAKAKKWPGFEEHAAEIQKVFTSDRKMDLHDAYMAVVFPKLSADRTTMRQEIMAELRKAPAGTSTQATTPAATPAASGQSQSIEDVIRASIAGLKR